jgi:hypothetical protein
VTARAETNGDFTPRPTAETGAGYKDDRASWLATHQ